ncbi:hypothetical protein [Streptomyces sp. CS014]|uniref:hypothetical protein n=1 Tax=Streptomyces sp. CS014 TaxID=2162707 RepID=UPI000D51B760|nr:hypothetical protein [Streptomyces sp. CS014]PVD04498.1 hypothetical protein DBP12_03470 [Streptomyces sp. CS014]
MSNTYTPDAILAAIADPTTYTRTGLTITPDQYTEAGSPLEGNRVPLLWQPLAPAASEALAKMIEAGGTAAQQAEETIRKTDTFATAPVTSLPLAPAEVSFLNRVFGTRRSATPYRGYVAQPNRLVERGYATANDDGTLTANDFAAAAAKPITVILPATVRASVDHYTLDPAAEHSALELYDAPAYNARLHLADYTFEFRSGATIINCSPVHGFYDHEDERLPYAAQAGGKELITHDQLRAQINASPRLYAEDQANVIVIGSRAFLDLVQSLIPHAAPVLAGADDITIPDYTA